MKTHKQKVIDLLTELGIGFTVDHPEYNPSTNILVKSSNNGVDGYCMFYNLFEFDEDGKFKVLGIWE